MRLKTSQGRSNRSLGGRRNVGCKLTAAVYFWPISCQISRYSAAKSSKTIPSLGPIFAQTPSAAQAPRSCVRQISASRTTRLRKGAFHLCAVGFLAIRPPTLTCRERLAFHPSISDLLSSIVTQKNLSSFCAANHRACCLTLIPVPFYVVEVCGLQIRR